MYTQKVLFNIGCADPGLPKDYVLKAMSIKTMPIKTIVP